MLIRSKLNAGDSNRMKAQKEEKVQKLRVTMAILKKYSSIIGQNNKYHTWQDQDVFSVLISKVSKNLWMGPLNIDM